ncbi:hypothetical protein H0H87_012760 [Tephrocybe sp. NHM501043]|nr:hypothetical protein H0H87_012760 [Tephrocybe sp. NHM501043]
MEGLHGDLVLAQIEVLVLDGDVLLDVLGGEPDLFVPPRAIVADEGPVRDGGGDAGDDEEEEVGLEAAAVDEGEEGLEEVRDDDDGGGEVEVVEGAVALACEADERRVFDCGRGRWVLYPERVRNGAISEHDQPCLPLQGIGILQSSKINCLS